ncbi:MAG: peptide ABC transporter substrate-binding protein [Treponema sp.]|jgi:peptide/nickel transport system substrate-binding protein/oligopeptide transport system substrate-binding protein|nr:peptide ABC transporter substrate-binding protein [Treponema sp.]
MKKKYSQSSMFFVILVIFSLVLTVFFVSCKTNPDEDESLAMGETVSPQSEENSSEELGSGDEDYSGEYAVPRPKVLNREELTVGFSEVEWELDFRKSYLANEAQMFTALYEGLFSYHPFTMEPMPAVARNWSVSEDKKEWTFTIRESARYWNGDPVLAPHFKSAWLSLISMEDAPYSSLFDIIEGAKEYRSGEADESDVGIECPDARTLVVRLNAPASFFPSMLCHHSFSPIHPDMLAQKDWKSQPPLSNGPFYIVEEADDSIILARNELYWDSVNVALKKLIFRFSQDGEEAANLWNSGEARWISGEVTIDSLDDNQGIIVNPMFATHYYFIRSVHKPWDDWRLRRALSISLPWEQLREGHFMPAETLIYPIPGYPEVKGANEQLLDEARQLLSDAGYAQGVGLPELVIRIPESADAQRIAGIMASTWKENLGVPVKVEVISFENYFLSLREDSYDVGSTTWIGDFADPYTFLQMWTKDSNLNDAKLNDTDYEKLIADSMTQEGAERWETLAEAEKLLLDRGTVLPISHSPAVNIVDLDEIAGWFPNALDIHPFKYLLFKVIKPLPGVV